MNKFENSRNRNDTNYIYGRIPSENSLLSNHVKKVYLQNGFSDIKILKNIEQSGLKPVYVDISELNKMAKGGNHQGIVVEIKPFNYASLDEIISLSKNKEQPLILVLDEIEDPHNFGAIIRSCDAFSVDGIIIKSRNQVPLNMTVAKVSTGAVEYVKVAQVSNLNAALTKLKENGYWIYAAEGGASEDYQKVNYDGAIALVVGSEGRGISRLVLENSDFIIRIPMTGHVNSLNVSVSTGILLSRIRNK